MVPLIIHMMRVFKQITFPVFFLANFITFSLASDRIDGRYSFSLTTFDPSGKLMQVERAVQAASLGTPVVAIVLQDEILLASPQILPSPLMQDDGTARFSSVTSEIAVAHTGISADGRVLVAAAQRLAIEHEYTYDENVPIEMFLEQMSLLFQEYTMKPAARPFGACLVVAFMPSKQRLCGAASIPALYRIDPSGSVEVLDSYAIVNGGLDRTNLATELSALSSEKAGTAAVEELVQSLKRAIQVESLRKRQKMPVDMTILTARLDRDGMFSVKRHDPSSE